MADFVDREPRSAALVVFRTGFVSKTVVIGFHETLEYRTEKVGRIFAVAGRRGRAAVDLASVRRLLEVLGGGKEGNVDVAVGVPVEVAVIVNALVPGLDLVENVVKELVSVKITAFVLVVDVVPGFRAGHRAVVVFEVETEVHAVVGVVFEIGDDGEHGMIRVVVPDKRVLEHRLIDGQAVGEGNHHDEHSDHVIPADATVLPIGITNAGFRSGEIGERHGFFVIFVRFVGIALRGRRFFRRRLFRRGRQERRLLGRVEGRRLLRGTLGGRNLLRRSARRVTPPM